MATIYAKNKQTGEWERVGPAANATDSTLTLAGSPADAQATGEAIDNIQIRIENLTAEDVGALPSSTEIPSIEGLASEEYVNTAATNAANAVKNDLLDGAGEAYDTLKELGALIDENTNALEALEILASVSEVEVSDTAPTDENVEIWVNMSEEPDGIVIGGSGSGGASSWNDLTDKPFYKEQSETVIIPEQTAETVQYEGADHAFGIIANTGSVEFIEGNTYEVVFDGTKYICVAKPFGNTVTIGNVGLSAAYGQEDSGEPFCLGADKSGVIFGTKTGGAFTVIVKESTETIHRIDPEYLPEGYPYKEQSEILPETMLTGNDATGMPITSAFDLIIGKQYRVKWNGVEYNCTAQGFTYPNGTVVACVGDLGSATGGESTGEPFIIMRMPDETVAQAGFYGSAISVDGSMSATVSITGEVVHQMSGEFMPEPLVLYVMEV